MENNIVQGDRVYFQLLDAVSTPVFLHRVGKVIYTNQAMRDLTAYSAEELQSLDFFELGHGEWRNVLKERGERRMRGEILPNVYEFRLANKLDKVCWVELTASRIMLNDLPTVFCSLNDLTDRKQAEAMQRRMQQMLAQIVDSDPMPTFVINSRHVVTHWNRACATLTGLSAEEMVGTNGQWRPFYKAQQPVLADLVVDNLALEAIREHYPMRIEESNVAGNAFEGERFLPDFQGGGRWFYLTAVPLRDASGRIIGAIEKVQDTTPRHRAEEALQQYQAGLEELVRKRTVELAEANQLLAEDIRRREQAEVELRRRNIELTDLNAKLSAAQQQLQQSEKLASIGQLAAGVAHEINNPIGYVHSNIGSLERYINDMFTLIAAYEKATPSIVDSAVVNDVNTLRVELDVDFLKDDVPQLLNESKEGITRVKKIVQDLKDFSRVDTSPEFQWANLHQGIDSTLNVVANEIKYKADVIKEYGALPEVECLPSQLNQVYMNLLVNAAQAMGNERGRIAIRTGSAEGQVWLEFADNGSGMSEDVQRRIFDPFFTTKPVGKGTGLGLSLSYGIIQKHKGRIEVKSVPGQGSVFRITLPIQQPQSGEQAS